MSICMRLSPRFSVGDATSKLLASSMWLVRMLIAMCGILFSMTVFAAPSATSGGANADGPAKLELAQPPAGRIDLVDGTVRLMQSGTAPRLAVVGDAVHEGDVLVTGNASEVHVTMLDTGFIALRANSRVKLVSYKADGSDDDKGVFRLLVGGLRAITGWIGKYNRKSYLVRTASVTIGVRGTDHEIRYIPPGSHEGAAGTYDKVFAGETLMQTAAGAVEVAAGHAGFVSDKGKQQPRVLQAIPGFFRPGPHEDIINKKHAEIQRLIDQRREERRKVIEQMRAELESSRLGMQSQVEKNKAANDARAAAAEQQRQEKESMLAALGNKEKTLADRQAIVKEMRKAITEKTAPEIAKNPELRKRIARVRKTFREIAQGFKDVQERRQRLLLNNDASQKARATVAEEQHKRYDAQSVLIGKRWQALKKKFDDIQNMTQAIAKAVNDPKASRDINDQHQALRIATDTADQEQRDLLNDQNALFENFIAALEARMAAAREERKQTALQLDAMRSGEEELRLRQQQNEAELESIQATAGAQGKIEGLNRQLSSVHAAAEEIRNARTEISAQYQRLRDTNMAALEERVDATLAQLKNLRAMYRDVQKKSGDLLNAREAMLEEIRALYAQEQKRYQEELRADRLLNAASNAEGQ